MKIPGLGNIELKASGGTTQPPGGRLGGFAPMEKRYHSQNVFSWGACSIEQTKEFFYLWLDDLPGYRFVLSWKGWANHNYDSEWLRNVVEDKRRQLLGK